MHEEEKKNRKVPRTWTYSRVDALAHFLKLINRILPARRSMLCMKTRALSFASSYRAKRYAYEWSSALSMTEERSAHDMSHIFSWWRFHTLLREYPGSTGARQNEKGHILLWRVREKIPITSPLRGTEFRTDLGGITNRIFRHSFSPCTCKEQE